MSTIDSTDHNDPVGVDPAVQLAARQLENAIIAAAERKGRTATHLAVVYVTRVGDEAYCGVLFCGKSSQPVTAFMADTLLDNSADIDVPEMSGRMN